MARQRYRSKLEVLRDLLVATRHASKKTRIMGLGNFNPATFRKHMGFAVDQGLVVANNGDYRLTNRADQVLAALQELMAKSTELDITIQFLERSGLPPGAKQWSEGAVLRQVSRLAWSEGTRVGSGTPSSFARSGAISSAPTGLPKTNGADSDPPSILNLSDPPSMAVARRGRRADPPSVLPERESPSRDRLRSHS